MRNGFLIISIALILFFIGSCNDKNNSDAAGKIFGQWELITPDAQVELFIFQDSTFHVDVLLFEGIEVEGKIVLDEEQITFINVEGTDSLSADPAPGIYKYLLSEDLLEFEKIEDPLSRRSNFLSQTWARIQ